MKPLRVLVVDDEPVIGFLLGDMLTEMGHTCSVETTKAAAVAGAAHFRPQFMIVDAQLGDGSGASVVDEILHMGPVPHVFISGNKEWIRILRLRAITLLKPFRRADIIRAMQDALGTAAAS
jgi:DNA-binding response OmpR family regulator